MGAGHHHGHGRENKERALWGALVLTSFFMIVEVFGGILTNSLALISDAAHMLTDVTALVIALMAIKIGKKAADNQRTFGYYRFEILAATLNTVLLFLTAFYIVYEAYHRLHAAVEVHSTGMLVIATLGLGVNLLSMWLLRQDKDKSLNVQGAYLEVWSDSLGSVGVIIGALLMQWMRWRWVDSIIAILIGLWVLPRTWVLLKASINILLEGVPSGIHLDEIIQAMQTIDGVLDVHELHVWGITNDKVSLTAHVVIELTYAHDEILSSINALLVSRFKISHTTLQLEYNKCLHDDVQCHFEAHR
jgi:cobalt-zinc-cadmium efflux system protein